MSLLAFVVAGGSSSSSSVTATQNSQQSAVFVTGEDAPLLAFNVTLNSITVNSSSTSVSVLSTAQTVDFARLLGLRTLIGFNSVAPGTYTSATIQLSTPVISYLESAVGFDHQWNLDEFHRHRGLK